MDITLEQALDRGQLPWQIKFLMREWGVPPYAKVRTVRSRDRVFHIAEIEPPQLSGWSPQEPEAYIKTNHYTIEFQKFQLPSGQIVELAYLSANNTLYIRDTSPEPNIKTSYKPSRGLREFLDKKRDKHPERKQNEGVLEWGHRLVKHGYIDNPQWRIKYQKAVYEAMFKRIFRYDLEQ